MITYLAFGLGLYIGSAYYNRGTFEEAPWYGIAIGLIMIPLWPLITFWMARDLLSD